MYRRALSQTPGSPIAHNNLANALFDRGQLEEAVREWHEALRIDPDCLEAHISLGNAMFSIDRLDEAEKESRAAIRVNRIQPRPTTTLG